MNAGSHSLIIHINLFQWREELLNEEHHSGISNKRCPAVQAYINGAGTSALIDSGSQVSCISEKFYQRNLDKFKDSPSLPITGMSIVGATGGRPVKLKSQVFSRIQIQDLETDAILLIVPNLSRCCLFGVDLLMSLKGSLNLGNETLTLKLEDRTYLIQTLDEDEADNTHQISSSLSMEQSDDLCEEELGRSLEANKAISPRRTQKYKELMEISMDVLFQRCLGKRVFSRLDLNMSFWQVPLDEKSQKHTGYVDNLLIVSEEDDEHLEHIELVLERLLENNITLNLAKCEFEKKRVNFLGHVLSAQGTEPDPEKIQAIRDYTRPRNKKQLQGFLGTVNFCSKFSEKFALEVVPILELLKKGKKWCWEDRHERAFNRVKDLFGSWVQLHFPDPKKEFYIQTDASDFALGAVIYQKIMNILQTSLRASVVP